MSDDRDVGYTVFGFFFGIFSFFWGFNRLRRKRLIENIPTSTVRGLAMGLVEVAGKAEAITLLKSPLSKTECVLYKYLVEKYRRSGKSGHWVKVASGDSFYSPFWLNDATGRITVFAHGAELILPVDYEFRTAYNREIPATLVEFMEENAIRYKSWLGTRALRFQEWFVRPGEEVYVLGSAQKRDTFRSDYERELVGRLEELKSSPERMKEADLNGDGNISIEEWDAAVDKVEQEMLARTLENAPFENPQDVFIGKSDEESTFIISDQSEKEVTRKLSMESFFGIYGGVALTLVCLAYLLFRFRVIVF